LYLGLARSRAGDKQAARQELEQEVKLKSNLEGSDEAWEAVAVVRVSAALCP
jgi:hypothetical protein